jgi:hypothetical protein
MKLTGLVARRVRGAIRQLWLWFKDCRRPTRPSAYSNDRTDAQLLSYRTAAASIRPPALGGQADGLAARAVGC